MNRFFKLLLFMSLVSPPAMSQLPTEEEAFRLIVTQKKATDYSGAPAFTKAPGAMPKFYHGHYTSLHNNECIVVHSLLQGRDIIQVALLLYKSKEGYWKNGCWYYDNLYRLKVKDFNKDSILEIILETRINAGSKTYAKYRIVSLLNQENKNWYENSAVLGHDPQSLKSAEIGKEVYRDVKVTIIDSVRYQPCTIKERTTIGKFNGFADSIRIKFDTETISKFYQFKNFLYVPAAD
jgi:hypothetical protein